MIMESERSKLTIFTTMLHYDTSFRFFGAVSEVRRDE